MTSKPESKMEPQTVPCSPSTIGTCLPSTNKDGAQAHAKRGSARARPRAALRPSLKAPRFQSPPGVRGMVEGKLRPVICRFLVAGVFVRQHIASTFARKEAAFVT
jgi:hypothetical protein